MNWLGENIVWLGIFFGVFIVVYGAAMMLRGSAFKMASQRELAAQRAAQQKKKEQGDP